MSEVEEQKGREKAKQTLGKEDASVAKMREEKATPERTK